MIVLPRGALLCVTAPHCRARLGPVSETVERRTCRSGAPLVLSSLMRKCFPAVLSVIAGSVDAISFLGLGGLFTAHVTGNLVILVAHLVTGNGARAAAILAVPVFVTALGLTRLLAGALESAGFASLRPLFSAAATAALSGFFVLCASAGAYMDPAQRRRLSRACSASRRWPCKTHSYRYR